MEVFTVMMATGMLGFSAALLHTTSNFRAACTVTAPAGMPQASPPTTTVYPSTVTPQSSIPCMGCSLAPHTPKVPASAYTATTTATPSQGLVYSISYYCCTERYLDAQAGPQRGPTSYSYIETVTKTSRTVCGGCELTRGIPFQLYPIVPSQSYTTTITLPKATQMEYTCTAHNTTVDLAPFSGSCTQVPETIGLQANFGGCPTSLNGLSGCPWACNVPGFDMARCYSSNITKDAIWDSYPMKPVCKRCLPPCSHKAPGGAIGMVAEAQSLYLPVAPGPAIVSSVGEA